MQLFGHLASFIAYDTTPAMPDTNPLAPGLPEISPLGGSAIPMGSAVRDILSGREGVVSQGPEGNFGSVVFVMFDGKIQPIESDQLQVMTPPAPPVPTEVPVEEGVKEEKPKEEKKEETKKEEVKSSVKAEEETEEGKAKYPDGEIVKVGDIVSIEEGSDYELRVVKIHPGENGALDCETKDGLKSEVIFPEDVVEHRTPKTEEVNASVKAEEGSFGPKVPVARWQGRGHRFLQLYKQKYKGEDTYGYKGLGESGGLGFEIKTDDAAIDWMQTFVDKYVKPDSPSIKRVGVGEIEASKDDEEYPEYDGPALKEGDLLEMDETTFRVYHVSPNWITLIDDKGNKTKFLPGDLYESLALGTANVGKVKAAKRPTIEASKNQIRFRVIPTLKASVNPTYMSLVEALGGVPSNWDAVCASVKEAGVTLLAAKEVPAEALSKLTAFEKKIVLAATGKTYAQITAEDKPTTPKPAEDPGAGMTWVWDKETNSWMKTATVAAAENKQEAKKPKEEAEMEPFPELNKEFEQSKPDEKPTEVKDKPENHMA